jgi:hypothetical protein
MDPKGFAIVVQKLTHYAIEMTMREWSAAKKLADRAAEGCVLDFEPKKECTKGCEASIRYSLLC